LSARAIQKLFNHLPAFIWKSGGVTRSSLDPVFLLLLGVFLFFFFLVAVKVLQAEGNRGRPFFH
jgi:hypothetical protein